MFIHHQVFGFYSHVDVRKLHRIIMKTRGSKEHVPLTCIFNNSNFSVKIKIKGNNSMELTDNLGHVGISVEFILLTNISFKSFLFSLL